VLSLTSVLMPCMKYTIHLYATALYSLVAVRPIVVCKPHYKLHSFSYRIIKTLPHGNSPMAVTSKREMCMETVTRYPTSYMICHLRPLAWAAKIPHLY